MKQFNLEAALRGEPVCTRDEKTVKIIAHGDEKNMIYPICAIVNINEKEYSYEKFKLNGKFYDDGAFSCNDLFMEEEKKETFKLYDRIIGKLHGAEKCWCIDLYSEKIEPNCKDGKTKTKCFGIRGIARSIMYSEVHHYEEWMEKYIGTTTPFREWKKGDLE